jgi:hypothetical protein
MWWIWGSDYAGDVGLTGVLLTLVWPTTLLFAVSRWAIISLPVVILRKRYLTGEVRTYTSMEKKLRIIA